LELRLRNLTSEEAKSLLKETIQRINAMALVHETIYRSDNLLAIDFKDYLQRLSGLLIHAYSLAPEKIDLQLTGSAVPLKLQIALPLGLIFNEMLTNAIKYAFQDGHGSIHVDLGKKDSILDISISDTGIGLPESVDPMKSKTFGFRIIRLLVEQLSGRLQVRRDNGTQFILSIPT
jgi:two-component sensor histidine kinase